MYVNRDDLDFGTASALQPTQTFSLSQTSDVQEVPVKRALFNTVRSLKPMVRLAFKLITVEQKYEVMADGWTGLTIWSGSYNITSILPRTINS